MRYEMHLNLKPFKQTVSNKKKLEVRINDSKRKLLNVGDEILFISRENEEKTVLRTITALRYYKSFEEMAKNEDCTLCCFKKGYNTQDVVDEYYKYYTPKEEKDLGVLIIEFSK